jgi:hypothetical protein
MLAQPVTCGRRSRHAYRGLAATGQLSAIGTRQLQ